MGENPEIFNLNDLNIKAASKYYIKNKYFIDQKVIGFGSTCKVYKGVNLLNKKIVAIKIIKDLPQNYLQKYNLSHQISILSSLNHPSIIKLEEVLQVEIGNKIQLFMIFQYFPFTLRDILLKRKNVSEKQVKNIIIKILQGLRHLDQRHVLHRDLKPQNILLSSDLETVKICDFGLSIVLDPKSNHNSRELGHHVMTRWYRAPQVILLLSQYSTKIDVWSFGCILFQLLQIICSKGRYQNLVLFCGKGCFPLSPPSQKANVEYKMKNGFPHSSKDQLFKIIQVLGTPGSTDFIKAEDQRSLQYLKSFKKCQNIQFAQLFWSEIPEWGLQLLKKTIKFNPNQRITAKQALLTIRK